MEHRKLRGMNLIRVQGTLQERARAHAVLLQDEIKKGAIPALAKKNEWLIRRSPGLLQIPAIQNLVVWLYKKILIPYMNSQLSAEEVQAVKVFSEITQLPYSMYQETLFQADAMMLLAKTSIMKHLLPEWIPGSLPGCTSAVALKSWTENGKLLVGRNFDYLIVGPWEEQTTIIFNEPSESDLVPFVNITTAGVHTAGLTAMNREGLTLSTHAHFSRTVALRGRPIVFVGDEIIQKAKTLGQAVDIARTIRPHANWSFVMSSAKENQAIVIEMSPDRVEVREAVDGLVTHSNYFHNAQLRKQEALLCGAYCEDLKNRICQMQDLLKPYRGQLKPTHIAAALGNHIDPTHQEERVFGNTLSVITTVKSVIFEPESQKMWVSSRNESPVGLGDYVEIDIDRFWKQPLDEYEKSMEVLPGYRPQNPTLMEGVRHYRNAYRAHHNESDHPQYMERTLDSLKKAATAYASDAHIWMQLGIVSFKMKLFKEAQGYFEKAVALPLSNHVTCVRDLYRARCLDLAGERTKALQLYQQNLDTPEPKLKKAFLKGLKRPYRASETSKMMIDLQFPDTFEY